MNIIAVKQDGSFCFRPDSTLNHQFLDYYLPDAVTAIEAVPVIYTRLVKAGKCIAQRFAHRYFDSFAFGFLINDCTPGIPEAMRFSLDQTSVMGMDFSAMDLLPSCRFTFEVNGEIRYSAGALPGVEEFAAALAAVTARSMLRLGDIVAIELAPATALKQGDSVTLRTDAGEHTIKIL